MNAEQVIIEIEAQGGEVTRARINQAFRENDESHKFPISGKFNATERAIRNVRKACRDGLELDDGLEYACALDDQITRIVNAQL